MAIIKNEVTNTWEVRTRYLDWTGAKKQKTKRGFTRKADAIEWEQNFQLKSVQDIDMTFGDFVDAFMLILLCTQFIPGAMLITPIFIIFKNLNMLNSLFALVLINTTFHFPFNSILMRGFIGSIDYTIEEAAQIDGCSRLGAIWHVLLPVLKPGIATIAAYGFISCWNEFLFSFMFISKQNKLTLPVGLKNLVGEFSINYGQLAAGAIIAVLPTLILFSYVQKNLVGGLSSGAVKG